MLIQIRKAQSTLEYALLIAVVVGALLWMQNYLKRAVQGRLRASGDEIGEQYSPGLTQKVENLNMSTAKVQEVTAKGFGGTTRTTITGGTQTSNATTDIKPLDQEVWK